MITEHQVEQSRCDQEQRCIRCGVLISGTDFLPFPAGAVFHEGVCTWPAGIDPTREKEARPCLMH